MFTSAVTIWVVGRQRSQAISSRRCCETVIVQTTAWNLSSRASRHRDRDGSRSIPRERRPHKSGRPLRLKQPNSLLISPHQMSAAFVHELPGNLASISARRSSSSFVGCSVNRREASALSKLLVDRTHRADGQDLGCGRSDVFPRIGAATERILDAEYSSALER
jgi:hypothetical protein